MTEQLELYGSAYPAVVLVVLGTGLAAAGLGAGLGAACGRRGRQPGGPEQGLTYLYVFRRGRWLGCP